MKNSADPDQLASSANWSGSTLFAKTGISGFSRTRVNYHNTDHLKWKSAFRFRSSCICTNNYPGFCSPFIHSVVPYDFISRQGRPYQTVKMHRLIWAFPVQICPKICFPMVQPILGHLNSLSYVTHLNKSILLHTDVSKNLLVEW